MSARRPVFVACALAALLGGCGQSETTQTPAGSESGMAEAMPAEPMPASPGMATGAAPLPLTAPGFAAAAASSDRYEMDAARLAESAERSSAVQAYAQMMMRDHMKSTNNLKTALSEGGITAKVDNQNLLPEHQAMLDALRAASPADFDRLYARQQVMAHQNTLDTLRTYSQSGDNKRLMKFAADTVPVVTQHLEAARKLSQ